MRFPIHRRLSTSIAGRGWFAGALFALVVATAPAVGLPVAEVPADDLDRLMELSGVSPQLEWIAPNVVAQVRLKRAEFGRTRVTPDRRAAARVDKTIEEAYSGERLQSIVRVELAQLLDPETVAAALRWFESETGRAFTEAEVAESSPKANRRREARQEKALEDLAPERRALLERLVGAQRRAESEAAIGIAMQFGIWRGLSANAPAPGVDPKELQRLEAERARITEVLRKTEVASAAWLYRDRTDAEIELYLAFAESESGRRFDAASVEAVGRALAQATVLATQRIAESAPGR